jgi:3-isopropylmalate dehydratase
VIATADKMPSIESQPRTLYDKVFQDHVVTEEADGTTLLYIGAPPF